MFLSPQIVSCFKYHQRQLINRHFFLSNKRQCRISFSQTPKIYLFFNNIIIIIVLFIIELLDYTYCMLHSHNDKIRAACTIKCFYMRPGLNLNSAFFLHWIKNAKGFSNHNTLKYLIIKRFNWKYWCIFEFILQCTFKYKILTIFVRVPFELECFWYSLLALKLRKNIQNMMSVINFNL